MSVYKVPQDVEAEDTLIGPFTLKQFIFLIVAAIAGYITFVLTQVNPILTILTIPIVIVFGILGVYRRPDQPVEIYLAALLRFYLKPRRRLWDQDGIMEPVHITAPPRMQKRYTDGRSENQVNSQLKNLANMMDTRGWSSKNASLQVPGAMGASPALQSSDRLIGRHELPQSPQPVEVHAADDMMDYRSNPVAQNVTGLAQNTATAAKQHAVTAMQEPIVGADGQYNPPTPAPSTIATPKKQSVSPMTSEPTPDIIRLSQNSDFNVSTLARQAEQKGESLDSGTEISLR